MFKINKFKLFIYFLIFISSYFSYIVYSYNTDISSYLNYNQKAQNTLIYFEDKEFQQNGKFSLDELLNELKNRSFRKSNENLKNSYQLKHNLLLINISEFIDFKGNKHQARKVAIDFNKKRIISLDNDLNSFILPPYPLISKNKSGISNKIFIPISKIPPELQKLIILNEDKNFYKHKGIDFIAILRAIFINLKSFSYKQGASTITQQVAKNLFLKREKTIARKFKEFIYTLLLEYRLEKKQILSIYLNEVYLGQKGHNAIYGVEKASKAFFSKNINELNQLEIASIVALVKEPGILSSKPKQLKEKALNILKKHNLEVVKNTDYKTNYRKISFKKNYSKYFHQALLAKFKNKYKLSNLNYTKIYTGLSEEMQACGNKVILNKLKKYPKLNASLVSINPNNGLVKAWVGGKNYSKSQFDRVVQSKRQIGSLIKPFIYLKAIEANKKLNPQSTVLDIPISIKLKNGKLWNPNNYDNKFLGAITLREALEKSRNMPAILTLKDIGVRKFLNFIKPLKLQVTNGQNPSIALGTIEASLLDITSAYTIFANGGLYVKPRLFKSLYVKDKLIENKKVIRNFSAGDSTYLVNRILNGVVLNGTARSLNSFNVSGNLCGKTGTTNSGRDFWFIGYTPKLVTGLWIGRDNNGKTKLSSKDLLLPVFGQYLSCIGKNRYDFSFKKERNIVVHKIDKKSQMLAHNNCPSSNVVQEFYRSSAAPKVNCSLH